VLRGEDALHIGCGREKENDMSSDNLRDREIAVASARRQALARTLMVERFGRAQQDRTEAARDSGPDDSGGIKMALHNRGCSWGLNPPLSRSDRAM